VRFSVAREPLAEAVSWVARALPSRPVLPLLSGMLLSAGTDGLALSCFDYEVWARATVEADVGEPGEALVPGRLLAEIVRSLPPFPVQVTGSAEAVTLACGPAEFTLMCLPAADYPATPAATAPIGAVDGDALAAAAAQVVSSASRDDTLPILTAVSVEADGETLTLAATDRYRLAVAQVGWRPARPDIRAVALVPARTLADAARGMPPGEPVTLGLGPPGPGAAPGGGDRGGPGPGVSQDALPGAPAAPAAASAGERPGTAAEPGTRGRPPRPADGMISFAGGTRQLAARLIGGEFVRYRSRFPAEFGCVAELPAVPLVEAVRRAALVAERGSPVWLTFQDGQAVIEARAEGRAKAVEKVPARFAGDQTMISFDPHYLLDGLTAAAVSPAARAQHPADGAAAAQGTGDGDNGRIMLRFTSPARPAMITWSGPGDPEEVTAPAGPAAERGFRYLLVPLRPLART
jgi:DNA polymerase-3 subunit beta